MKISSEIHSSALHVGEEKAIELMAKAGFDAWDFSMFNMCKYDWGTGTLLPNNHPLCGPDYLAFARKLKQVGLDNGIHCNQSHAPFPSSCKPIRDHLKRAIECTAEAGGKICVIHPVNDNSPEENAELYFEFLPFAKDHGVKIATENMWNWDNEACHSLPAACSSAESFMAHVDAVNDPYLVACLDIGHAEMKGSGEGAVKMIHALGHRLQALHLHDNDLLHDSHQILFSDSIDFEAVAGALKAIGYSGYLTLEADRYLADFSRDTVFAGLQELANSARKLAEMYDLA